MNAHIDTGLVDRVRAWDVAESLFDNSAMSDRRRVNPKVPGTTLASGSSSAATWGDAHASACYWSARYAETSVTAEATKRPVVSRTPIVLECGVADSFGTLYFWTPSPFEVAEFANHVELIDHPSCVERSRWTDALEQLKKWATPDALRTALTAINYAHAQGFRIQRIGRVDDAGIVVWIGPDTANPARIECFGNGEAVLAPPLNSGAAWVWSIEDWAADASLAFADLKDAVAPR